MSHDLHVAFLGAGPRPDSRPRGPAPGASGSPPSDPPAVPPVPPRSPRAARPPGSRRPDAPPETDRGGVAPAPGAPVGRAAPGPRSARGRPTARPTGAFGVVGAVAGSPRGESEGPVPRSSVGAVDATGSAAARRRRGVPAGLAAAGVGAVLVAAAALAAGCASLGKDALETRLLALEGNAPAARWLESREMSLPTDGGGAERVRVRYLRAGPSVPPGPPGVPDAAGEGGASGPGSRPLVLVHGTPGSLLDWTEVVLGHGGDPGLRGLAADREVWAVDVVGHGITEHDPGELSFQECADWVVAFLRAADLADVVLVGHSYGGEVAWRAALDAPDRVARLVLVDSAGFRRSDDAWLPEEEAMREIPGARWGYLLNSRDRIRSALEPHFAGAPPAELVEEMFLVCENASNWAAMVDLARDEEGRRQDEIAAIGQPTLLLWGASDVAYPVEGWATRFEREIRDARLVTLDAGHYPHVERPRDFVAELRAFSE